MEHFVPNRILKWNCIPSNMKKQFEKERKLFLDFYKVVVEEHPQVVKIEIECNSCSIGGESDAGWVANFYYWDANYKELTQVLHNERDIKDMLADLTQKLMPPSYRNFSDDMWPRIDMKFVIKDNYVIVFIAEKTYKEI